MAKKMTGNISPWAMAFIMLSGTMAMSWSTKDTLPTARSVTVSFKLRSTFSPGLNMLTSKRPRTQAIRVVITYHANVLPAMRPRSAAFPTLQTPMIRALNTSGITTIFSPLRKRSPAHFV